MDLTISTGTITVILGIIGGGGILGLLSKLYNLRKQLDDKRDEKSCVLCRGEVEVKLQKIRDDALMAVRVLESRVVDAEKETLELRGDVKILLSGMSEMKQMLNQLQSDVSAIAIQQRSPLMKQQTGRPDHK